MNKKETYRNIHDTIRVMLANTGFSVIRTASINHSSGDLYMVFSIFDPFDQRDGFNVPGNPIMNVHSTSEITNQSAPNRRNLLCFL